MSAALELASVARPAASSDNVAIAIRRLDAGTVVRFRDGDRALRHTVLEGHRFAICRIESGQPLLSWGHPFGRAAATIEPGDYVTNVSTLAALAVRQLGVPLPARANFTDVLAPYELDERTFRASPPVEQAAIPRTFAGYRRPGRRGTGTRNYIVILGTTSRTASFARQLAARLQPLARVHPQLDGIVAIAHTEGGGNSEPNNAAELLRALAGFMVHPNVGAVLAVDYGVEPVTNARLRTFMREHNYPLGDVPHEFLSIDRGVAQALAAGEATVRGWLPAVAAERRTEEPLSGLRIALQCGGSDAFSGISGNPLAGAIVHELIRNGGTGVLSETDELVGAESYLCANIAGFGTARRLLGFIEEFKRRLANHGTTAESNPSAGNKLRGLYNITLKSLGAVHKKDPRTRLDGAIDYAEPLVLPGFHFMNGPGNDLESIAGEVASGCNLILFSTGNGSITNFPFVPTLKITTTTRRHLLLINEMDINAGRYLDGEPFEALAAESFDLALATAGGRRTQGERAGHSQVSILRNWQQADGSRVDEIRARPKPDGRPLADKSSFPGSNAVPSPLANIRLPDAGSGRPATERIGLVLPTSLCAGQIARIAAERMNAGGLPARLGLSRFVPLAHTEGCGFGGESMYRLLERTYRGYITHPNVAAALLLEHGCEKIPNDAVRRHLESADVPTDRFGWASVQLDGGIENAIARVEQWFAGHVTEPPPASEVSGEAGPALTIGLMSDDAVTRSTAEAFASVARAILASGGSILVPESDALLANDAFTGALIGDAGIRPTLAYGEPASIAGFHVVATESDHWVENLTGLGGCGAHLFLTAVSRHAQQGHPMLPVIQVAEADLADTDARLSGDRAEDARLLATLVADAATRSLTPAATAAGCVDFQLSRGLLGVST